MVGQYYRIKHVPDWRLIVVRKIFSKLHQFVFIRKDRYQLVPLQKYVFTKKQYFSINLWSAVHYDISSHSEVTNDSDG